MTIDQIVNKINREQEKSSTLINHFIWNGLLRPDAWEVAKSASYSDNDSSETTGSGTQSLRIVLAVKLAWNDLKCIIKSRKRKRS